PVDKAPVDKAPDLTPLIGLLAEIDDPAFQLDVLKGMLEGLRGRKTVKVPSNWAKAYPKLSKSDNAEVRQLTEVLALTFGDPVAIAGIQARMMNAKVPNDQREAALNVLVERRIQGLAPSLHKLLASDALRRPALRGLASYNHQATPEEVLSRYAKFTEQEKHDAVATLSSRATYAKKLLDAMEKKTVAPRDVSAFIARQLHSLGDATIDRRLRDLWGEIRATSQQKQQLIAKYKKRLNPKFLKKANLGLGRLTYSRICQKCHKLYGEGGTVGPDLTGSNRFNLDYVLENVLDPNALIGKDFRMHSVATTDGRVLTGIILERNNNALGYSDASWMIFESFAMTPCHLFPEMVFARVI
ncbi:MAG: hypothetical protein N2C14_16115, partial [Planctomycetales bacterium]